jgi:pimeloyl-ACP methyl ester carboxylesterase
VRADGNTGVADAQPDAPQVTGVTPASGEKPAIPRDDPLPRRGYLGLRVLPLVAGNAARLGLQDTTGVWVQLLSGRSPLAKAGLEVDDVIRAVNDASTLDVPAFRDAVTDLRAGDPITFDVVRGNRPVRIEAILVEAPREQLPGLDIDYRSFATPGGPRLRAIVSRPAGNPEPRPAVLLVQDAIGPTVEMGGYNLYRDLAFRLSVRGYAVLRHDRRGMGDSEGENYLDTDFQTEVEDTGAALDFLLTLPGVDPERIYVFGYSIGGLVAAEVVSDRTDVAGLVVFGSPGRPWLEYAPDSWRLQKESAGVPREVVAREFQIVTSFFESVRKGVSTEDIIDQNPEWAPVVLDWWGRPWGRNAAFYQQLAGLDVNRTFGSLRCPVLVLQGEADMVTPEADARAIVSHLTPARPGDHAFILLPDTDHLFARATSAVQSAHNLSIGEIAFYEPALDPIVTWLDGRGPRD